MYHIGEALVRWMAPILSFTAEEIWENMPGEREESVLLAQWYDQLQRMPSEDAMGDDFWQQIVAVRDAVNKEMEVKRSEGALRGSLDASVALYCGDAAHELLASLDDELRFVLITSEATLLAESEAPATATSTEVPGLKLTVNAATYEKCQRCWHRRPEVGSLAEHPTLCSRCVDNIEGPGEQRHYA